MIFIENYIQKYLVTHRKISITILYLGVTSRNYKYLNLVHKVSTHLKLKYHINLDCLTFCFLGKFSTHFMNSLYFLISYNEL